MYKPPRSTAAFAAAFVCTVSVACASTTAQSPVAALGLSSAIGWVHGDCIALVENNVAAGTDVTLVSVDSPRQEVTRTHIHGHADGPEGCPALLDDRAEANRGGGWTFYRIEPGSSGELAIGVLGRTSPEEDPEAGLDLDGDGQSETFSYCATAEGARFNVWAGAPWRGEPVWSGYYYLGYDMQADCPER